MECAALKVLPFSPPEPTTEPATCDYVINGHPCQVQLWSAEQWDALPEHARPLMAQRIGSAWMEISPRPVTARA